MKRVEGGLTEQVKKEERERKKRGKSPGGKRGEKLLTMIGENLER